MVMSDWWSFRGELVTYDRDDPGVYEFGDESKTVVYIGSSVAVRSRLQQHLHGNDPCIKNNAKYYRIEYREDYKERERKLYDLFEQTYGRPTKCNDRRT